MSVSRRSTKASIDKSTRAVVATSAAGTVIGNPVAETTGDVLAGNAGTTGVAQVLAYVQQCT